MYNWAKTETPADLRGIATITAIACFAIAEHACDEHGVVTQSFLEDNTAQPDETQLIRTRETMS